MGLRDAFRSRPWKVLVLVTVVAVAGIASVVLYEDLERPSTSSTNPLCTASPCAPEISGWLHTKPGSLEVFDAGGSAVPLRGINVDGLDFGTGNPSSDPDACGKGWSLPSGSASAVASWGFNFVRIPISWSNLEPTAPTFNANGTWTHHWNWPYVEELDSVASQFAAAHLAVVWDFGQVDVSPAFQDAPEKTQGGECEGWGNPTWLYPNITSPSTSKELASAMCSFFDDDSLVGTAAPPPIAAMESVEDFLAARYASDPTVVGIDIYNEPWFEAPCGPTSSDGALLTSFYTQMGQVIAQADPHLLLVFEEPPPGLMASSPIMSSPPSVPNTVYEFHIYTSDWETAEPYVQAYLHNAQQWGVPVWLGEFDAFEAGCTGVNCTLDPQWQADTQSLLSFCDANDINWSYFSYYSLGEPGLQAQAPHSEILSVLQPEI